MADDEYWPLSPLNESEQQELMQELIREVNQNNNEVL